MPTRIMRCGMRDRGGVRGRRKVGGWEAGRALEYSGAQQCRDAGYLQLQGRQTGSSSPGLPVRFARGKHIMVRLRGVGRKGAGGMGSGLERLADGGWSRCTCNVMQTEPGSQTWRLGCDGRVDRSWLVNRCPGRHSSDGLTLLPCFVRSKCLETASVWRVDALPTCTAIAETMRYIAAPMLPSWQWKLELEL